MKFNGVNVRISKSARIGKGVRIGDNTAIYDNVIIGDNSIVCDNCIIGEPLSDYYYDESYSNPPTVIGTGALIRSNAIIYAGCDIGNNFSSGHRITLREYSKIGNNCKLGTLDDLQGYLKMGDNCWLHSNVHIGQKSNIGNFVFIYPYVVFTNDPTPPSDVCIGPTVDDFSQIAVHSLLLPGVHVGKHCLVGAGTVVTKDVDDYKLILGNPGKIIKDVREIKDRITGESHYPWPYRFKRGMPWEQSDFGTWCNDKKNK